MVKVLPPIDTSGAIEPLQQSKFPEGGPHWCLKKSREVSWCCELGESRLLWSWLPTWAQKYWDLRTPTLHICLEPTTTILKLQCKSDHKKRVLFQGLYSKTVEQIQEGINFVVQLPDWWECCLCIHLRYRINDCSVSIPYSQNFLNAPLGSRRITNENWADQIPEDLYGRYFR